MNSILATVVGVATKHPKEIIIVLLMALSYWWWDGWSDTKAKLANLTMVLENVNEKTAAAEKADREHAEKVRLQYELQLAEVKNENRTLRERNRSILADRLQRPTETAGSRFSAADLSSLPVVSDGVLPASGAAVVSEADLRICADNYTQLIGLIAAWPAEGVSGSR